MANPLLLMVQTAEPPTEDGELDPVTTLVPTALLYVNSTFSSSTVPAT